MRSALEVADVFHRHGADRWSALIVGFVGVLIITHPGAGTLTYGALFALVNAVLISTVAIAIRRMSMTESAETLTLSTCSRIAARKIESAQNPRPRSPGSQ